MPLARPLTAIVLCAAAAGCVTVGHGDNGETSTTFNLGWLIGGIAMAVDGDDRDDHMHWFEDDDCDCKCKRH